MGMKEVFEQNPGPPLHHVRRQGRARQDDVLGRHGVLARVARGRRCWCSPSTRRHHSPTSSRRTSSARVRSRSWTTCGRRRSTPTATSRPTRSEIRKKILDMYGLDGRARGDRELHPGRERRAGDGGERDLRRRGGRRRQGRLRLLHLRPRPARPRALLPARWPRSTTSGSTRSRSCARRCASTRRWSAASSARRRPSRTRSSTSSLYIKGRINTSSEILTDKEKTAFFFVVMPEDMIINDTQKAAKLFAQFDVPIGGYVVNRVIPHELLDQNIPRLPAQPHPDAGQVPREHPHDVRRTDVLALRAGARARRHRPADDREARRDHVRRSRSCAT